MTHKALKQAAQAVLDRWNSPKWDWHKQGPTADLMAKLTAAIDAEALAALKAQPSGDEWVMPEPVKGGFMNCEDCDGTGSSGESPRYMGEFQPPEPDPCPSCMGYGLWAGDLFTADQLRAAHSAGLAARIPAGWQPIETAPKDFVTEFDGWNGERVNNVSWAHPEGANKGEYDWCVSEYINNWGNQNSRARGLTHWMPLPVPPITATEAPAKEPK